LTSTWLYAVAGVLVVVAICAVLMFWLTHRRRKIRVSVSMHRLGDQPYLSSSDRPGTSGARKFAKEFEVGTEVPVTVPGPGGDPEQRVMRISRLSAARGQVDGRIGVQRHAYLEEFEGTELPISLPVAGDRGVTKVTLDGEGVSGRTPADVVAWKSPWSKLRFVNSLPTDADPTLVLRASDYSELHIKTTRGAGAYAEGLIAKYGRLAHPNTWDRKPGTLGIPATPDNVSTEE
jgi:hypothetical protein